VLIKANSWLGICKQIKLWQSRVSCDSEKYG